MPRTRRPQPATIDQPQPIAAGTPSAQAAGADQPRKEVAIPAATPSVPAVDYTTFLRRKSQLGDRRGFKPLWMPDFLYPFQQYLVDWSIWKGCGAEFADCVAGETLVSTSTGPRRIDELAAAQQPVRVWCWTPDGTRLADASAPWINGVAPLYELRFASGRSLIATRRHRLFSSAGWVRVEDLRSGDRILASSPYPRESSPATGPSTRPASGPRSSRTTPGSTGSYSACCHPDGGQPLPGEGVARSLLPSRAGALGHIRPHSHVDDSAGGSGCIRRRRSAGRPSMLRSVPPVATTVAGEGFRLLASDRTTPGESNRTYRRVAGDTIPGRPVLGSRPSAAQGCGDVLCEASGFSWDTLLTVHYIRTDVFYDMEVPGFSNYFANGLVSHNCGLGKSPMQLVWAENVVRYSNKPVLILAPLGVSFQVCREADKFGIEAHRSDDGKPCPNITVTNYERLKLFSPDDYAGVVVDEASILKHWSGATQKAVTRFMSQVPYRLLCTATPSPNAFEELGTMSEAIGEMNYSDMLATFFRELSDEEKKGRARADDIVHSRRLSWRVIQSFGQWALRAHAHGPFWRWVAGWARACRKPSDLGDFDDAAFVLPPLNRRDHTVVPRTPPPGWLFTVPAIGLNQERGERNRTIEERAELVASLADHADPVVVWCEYDDEADRMERAVKGAVQVHGQQSLERKEELILAFLNGQARGLVTKAKIAGLGLNMQHCAHVVTFVTHSYEKFYQSVRRCHRFGQTRPVTLDVIATEGEVNVAKNLARKELLNAEMFDSIVRHMNDAQTASNGVHTRKVEVPSWLRETN